MSRPLIFILILSLFFGFSSAGAQSDEKDLQIFGYFQSEFQYIRDWEVIMPDQTSFLLQQLNLFVQRDVSRRWTSFINFELINSYSSQQGWGEFSIEEAWLRFSKDRRFNLKAGLFIPKFNNLNEIKNKTPILPYIIRLLAYETSMKAYVHISEFTPERANVQVYGFLQSGNTKIDYAAYIGNSPNISKGEYAHSGTDTTTTFLFGGRAGIRYNELKLGLSVTRDKLILNEYVPIFLSELRRTRIGGDLSFNINRFSFEGEVISVFYREGVPRMKINRRFYYGTVGYDITDRLFGYVSFWYTRSEVENYARGKIKL